MTTKAAPLSQPVHLERVVSGNPFSEHPQLRTIWARAWKEHVEADTLSDLKMGDNDPAKNHIYLVRDEQENVIGITGFYALDADHLGLRWHGIIPAARGAGASKAAFAAVCVQAQQATTARAIIEYVEMSDPLAPKLIKHFTSLGFQADGPAREAETFPAITALPAGSGLWTGLVFALR